MRQNINPAPEIIANEVLQRQKPLACTNSDYDLYVIRKREGPLTPADGILRFQMINGGDYCGGVVIAYS